MVPLAAIIIVIRHICEAHIIAARICLEKMPMSVGQQELATLGHQVNAVGVAYPSQQRGALPCMSQHTAHSSSLAAGSSFGIGSARQGLP